MKQFILQFVREEKGQDLVEYIRYCWPFVCLASAALFIQAGSSLSGIWGDANGIISNANTAASS